ncbi:nitric oxide reductase activation protein NorD [Amorphus orientalis]|uniref:VWFA domain-containing protein n=1 Tax=Amorphus orientalis TaxID=649198 RepID=A0AAE4AT45_9HYPH|nr:VWA domain-containing protein [Amorphus orientalis]MDQ0315777.1 hypothetical protein [Amorphus orientalis]
MSGAAHLTLLSTPEDSPVTLAHRIIGQREALRVPFREAFEVVSRRADTDERDRWCSAVLAMANANAGPTALLAGWQLSREQISRIGPDRISALLNSATDTCKRAGAKAAASLLREAPLALRILGDPEALLAWGRIVTDLAEEMPAAVLPLLTETGRILSQTDIEGFRIWVEAGRRATERDRLSQIAFFSLEDPGALRLLSRSGRGQPFDRLEKRLSTYATALYGRPAALRSFEPSIDATAPSRANIAGGLMRLPLRFPAPEDDQDRIFLAAVAHIGAHLEFSRIRFEVGKLRPLQIALVNLAEDHRVETLAARSLPGLAGLWRSFHTIAADTPATTDNLLARIARALADPGFEDDDWAVSKARALFAERADRLEDPQISREFGSLLGNDFGQRRLQFNWKTYAVEPIYRDDGLGLWELPEDDAPPETIEMFTDAARPEESDNPPEREDGRPDPDLEPAELRPISSEDGLPIARYPEWDYRANDLRHEWACVCETPATLGSPSELGRLTEPFASVHEKLVRQIRSARIGRAERLKRQPDGDVLDLEAAIEHTVKRRLGELGDDRLFVRRKRQARDLSTLVLLDVSQSTGDRPSLSTATVLELELAATALLGRAMDDIGDCIAIRSFASNGRDDVRISCLKDFDERFDDTVAARLAGARSGLSTRLGAAIRHATVEIAPERAYRRLIAVITDGEPSDIDVTDSDYLAYDAQHAVRAARRLGVDVVCIALSTAHLATAKRVFGAGHVFPVSRIDTLPTALSAIIFRLATR